MSENTEYVPGLDPGSSVPIKWLAAGERFHFPHSDRTYTAKSRGWYVDGEGRRFKTGLASHVIRAAQIDSSGSEDA